MRNHIAAHFIFSLCLFVTISVSAWPGNGQAADADNKHGDELIFGVSSTFPGQKIYFVIIDDYIYLVPHIVREEFIFLKTIIPSRKATKVYQREQGGKNEIR